jgi:preprotein translocase subunit YajC
MNMWALLLAQDAIDATGEGDAAESTTEGAQTGDPAAGEPVAKPGFFEGPMPMIIMLMVVMWFFLIRGPQKKQRKHKEMLNAIEKNARVQTIGGILGTVVEVREQEVVIKVDESNNTKMHFARSAIGRVITETETQ